MRCCEHAYVPPDAGRFHRSLGHRGRTPNKRRSESSGICQSVVWNRPVRLTRRCCGTTGMSVHLITHGCGIIASAASAFTHTRTSERLIVWTSPLLRTTWKNIHFPKATRTSKFYGQVIRRERRICATEASFRQHGSDNSATPTRNEKLAWQMKLHVCGGRGAPSSFWNVAQVEFRLSSTPP